MLNHILCRTVNLVIQWHLGLKLQCCMILYAKLFNYYSIFYIIIVNSGDTNSRSTDIQAADSGFSSSSPADRQSPSPKVWFPLTLTEQTKAEPAELNITSLPGTNTTTSDIRSTIEPDTHIGGSTAPITAPEANIDSNVGHNVMDTSPTNINSCPENTRVTTQVLDKPSREPAAFTDGAVTPIGVDGALDLSSNSTSFPRMHLPPEMAIDQSTPQQSYNNPSAGPTNPPRLLASSVQTQQLFNQQMKVDAFMPTPLDLHAPTKPTVSSLNNLLETLAAQVTGDASGSHQSEAAKRETNAEQDAANLVKLNKKAEPPNCGCTNRPCKFEHYILHICLDVAPYFRAYACTGSFT